MAEDTGPATGSAQVGPNLLSPMFSRFRALGIQNPEEQIVSITPGWVASEVLASWRSTYIWECFSELCLYQVPRMASRSKCTCENQMM